MEKIAERRIFYCSYALEIIDFIFVGVCMVLRGFQILIKC